jgi:hypothetical protein
MSFNFTYTGTAFSFPPTSQKPKLKIIISKGHSHEKVCEMPQIGTADMFKSFGLFFNKIPGTGTGIIFEKLIFTK